MRRFYHFAIALLFCLSAIGKQASAVIRNVSTVRHLQALVAVTPNLTSGEWGTCEETLGLAPNGVPIGMLAQLDCPAVLQRLSHGNKPALTEVEAFWYGYVLERSGQHFLGVQAWQTHAARISRYFISLAGYNIGQSNTEASEKLSRLAVEIEPHNWWVHWQRGAMLRVSHPNLAVEALQRAVDLAPEELEAHLWLGQLQLEQGNYPAAMEACRTAVEIAPGRAEAWQCLGEAAFQAGEWNTAEGAFKTQLALAPNDAWALFWLGRIYRYTGRYEQAIFWLGQAVRATGDHGSAAAYAWYELGYSFVPLGRREEAVHAFRRVQELEPNFLYIEDVIFELSRLEAGK